MFGRLISILFDRDIKQKEVDNADQPKQNERETKENIGLCWCRKYPNQTI